AERIGWRLVRWREVWGRLRRGQPMGGLLGGLRSETELLPTLKERRAGRAKAERVYAKRRTAGLKSFLRAYARLDLARKKQEAVIVEFNERRTGRVSVSRKRPYPQSYALTPLIEGLFELGVPDRTTATLLALAGLPKLSPRQVKRIRTGH